MKEFFKGWRRKIGVLTLVMACLFAQGWVRSKTIDDEFIYATSTTSCQSIASFHSHLIWTTFPDVRPASKPEFFRWDSEPSVGTFNEWYNSNYRKWKWRVLGFSIGKFVGQREATFVVIPYWSIVVPLTALSVFVLLKKPKTSTPKKIPDPVENDVGAAS